MSFTPALFKNFGKSVKDLFDAKKKFSTKDHSVIVRNSSANGITLTHTSNVSTSAASVVHELKANYANAAYGKFEFKATTAEHSGKVVLNKLHPGVEVELNAKQGEETTYDVAVSLRQDMFAGSLQVKQDKSATVTLAVGVDNVSVGGSVVAAQGENGHFAVADYNGAAQYEQNDLTVSLVTSEKADQINLYLNQIINKDVTVAAQGTYNFSEANKGKNGFFAGGSVALDNSTALKGMLSHKGDLSTSLEHKFRDFAKLGVVSAFNITGSNKAQFGVTLTLGQTEESK